MTVFSVLSLSRLRSERGTVDLPGLAPPGKSCYTGGAIGGQYTAV